jgi:DNA-binding NtrC family response regulator
MPSAKAKLLIVDDDVALRMSLSQILTEFGHSARSAEDGFSALRDSQEMPQGRVASSPSPSPVG